MRTLIIMANYHFAKGINNLFSIMKMKDQFNEKSEKSMYIVNKN